MGFNPPTSIVEQYRRRRRASHVDVRIGCHIRTKRTFAVRHENPLAAALVCGGQAAAGSMPSTCLWSTAPPELNHGSLPRY